MRHFIILLPVLCFIACRQNVEASKKKITFSVTLSTSGYGYAIIIDGKKVIDQPHIPGVSATSGFSDSAGAANTARLVVQKINRQQWPPSISEVELDSLGVLYR